MARGSRRSGALSRAGEPAGAPGVLGLADAVKPDVWRDAGGRLSGRGHRTFAGESKAVAVLWRSSGERSVLLAAFVDVFLAPPEAAAIAWHLSDAEDRTLTGVARGGAAPATRLVDAEYPWKLDVQAAPAAGAGAGSSRAVVVMLAVTLAFVWGSTYLMSRAIRRSQGRTLAEGLCRGGLLARVRCPLTTVRQLAEMLETGRLPARHAASVLSRVGAGGRAPPAAGGDPPGFRAHGSGRRTLPIRCHRDSALVRSVARDVEAEAHEAGVRLELNGRRRVSSFAPTSTRSE